MNQLDLDVARALHRDRERMVAEAFRAGGAVPTMRHSVPAWTQAASHVARVVLTAIDHAAVVTGQRLHVAH